MQMLQNRQGRVIAKFVAFGSLLSATILGALALLQIFGSLDELAAATSLLADLARIILQIPWWVLCVVALALILLSTATMRWLYAREVIIQSDFEYVDLRASSKAYIDGSKGRVFLLRPVEDLRLERPKNLREAVYRLFILTGTDRRKIELDDCFELMQDVGRSIQLEPDRLYEFQILAIGEGDRSRFFFQDMQAYEAAVQKAKRAAFGYAMMLR